MFPWSWEPAASTASMATPSRLRLGYVQNGDMVMVEQTSASTPSTKVTTVLKIGGLNTSTSPWLIRNPVTATFSSTTE